MKTLVSAFALALLVSSFPVIAQDFPHDPADVEAAFAKKNYSPYAGRAFPTQVFWGDTHLHTELSMDAGSFGNRLSMDDAYRFARGEEIVSSTGVRARLSRPLDFLVVSDHSDGMGFFPMLLGGDPKLMGAEEGRRWNRMVNEGGTAAVDAALEDHRPLLAWRVSVGAERSQHHATGVGRGRRRGRTVQRSRTLHRVHRLRVDVAGSAWQQHAPGRDLPRRR